MFVCNPPMDSHCPSGNGPNALVQPELDSGSFPAHLCLSSFSALLSQSSCMLYPLSDKDCRHLPRRPFCFHPTTFISATFCLRSFKSQVQDFPSCSVVNNPPANAGNMSSIPGPGRSHMPRSNKPMSHSKRSHCNEKLTYHKEMYPCSLQLEEVGVQQRKTQCRQKMKYYFLNACVNKKTLL